VGDPASPGAPPTAPGGIFFLWAPLHWEDRCTHMCVFENEYGVPWHFDGMICPVYPDPADIPGTEDPATIFLASGEHQLSFVPGTRRASAAKITLVTMEAKREEIELDPVLCFRMKGLGYLHNEWGHGRWKGKCADLDENALDNVHVQQLMIAKSGDKQGIGVLEQIHIGPHAGYGFKDFIGPG